MVKALCNNTPYGLINQAYYEKSLNLQFDKYQHMNKTVELVNSWAAFEKQYPNGTIEDFHRRSFSYRPGTKKSVQQAGKLVPDLNGRLIILLTRIGKFHMSYSNKAFEGTGLEQI